MNRESNIREDSGYVNIHGQDIRVYICEKTGEILVPIDEIKEMGFRLYRKSQYNRLLIDDNQFNNEFNLHMLQSAQSYMLHNKIAFKENDILESINKCKQALTGATISQNRSEKDSFAETHQFKTDSDQNITITTHSRQSFNNFKIKSPPSSVKSKDYDRNGFDQNGKRDRKSFNPIKNDRNSFEANLPKQRNNFSTKDDPDWDTKSRDSQQENEKIPTIEFDKPEHNVVVSFIEKPNYIWVQDTEKAEKILEITSKVQEEMKNLKKEYVKYALNKIFLAQQDGIWYRCKIIKYKPLTVFFVDYGNTAQVNELKYASDELSRIPGQAVKITFNESQYQPKDNDEINIKIKKRFDNGTYLVQVEENVPTKITQKTFFKKPQPLCHLENGQKVMIISQRNETLVLRTRECYDKIREIETLLEKEETKTQAIDKVELGQLVLCKNEKLQRAIVTNIDKSVEIEFLDYYEKLKVDSSSLKHITEALAQQPITYILTPVIKNYNAALADSIKDLIVKKSKCTVVLTDGEFDLNIGDKLLSQLQTQNLSNRHMIQQFEIFKPELGFGEYMFNCFHSIDAVYFSPQEALQDYLDNIIITELDDINPYEPIIDEVCLGYYQGSWSRCLVLNLNNRRYKVRFIDFGNLEYLQSDQLRKLPKEAKVAPIIAFRCQLTGLPKKLDIEEKIQSEFHDGESYLINIKKHNGDVYEIEIPTLYDML